MANFSEEIVIKLKDQFTPAMEKMTSALTTFKGAAGLGAAILALEGLRRAVAAPIEQFSHFQREAKLLENALKSQGLTTKASANDLMDYAESLQDITTFSNEAAMEAERLLLQFGLTGDVLKKTVLTAMNASVATGKDLNEVINQLGKAYHGHTEQLQRMGISLNENEKKVGNFDLILDKFNHKFGGAAAADVATYSGHIAQLSNNFGDLLRNIGASTVQGLEDSGIIGFINRLTKKAVDFTHTKTEFEQLQKKIDELRSSMSKLQATPELFGGEEQVRKSIEPMQQALDELLAKQQTLNAEKQKDVDISNRQALAAKARVNAEIDDENAERLRKEAEEIRKNQEELHKFYRDLGKDSRDDFEQIEIDRKDDLEKLREYLIKKGNETEKAEKYIEQIEKKAHDRRLKANFDMTFALVKTFGDASTSMKDKLVATFPVMVSAMAQGMARLSDSAKEGAVKNATIVGAVFSEVTKDIMRAMDFLNKSTRGAFGQITDQLRGFQAAVKDAFAALKEFREYQTQKSAKHAGEIIAPSRGPVGYLPDDKPFQDWIAEVFGESARGEFGGFDRERFTSGNFKWSVDNGDFALAYGDSVLGIVAHDDPGVVKVMNRLGSYTEGGTRTLVSSFYNWLKKTGQIDLTYKDPNAPAVEAPIVNPNAPGPYAYADGGMVFGAPGNDKVKARLSAGEFVVSRKGVNQKSLGLLKALNEGMMPSSGTTMIQIHAMDALSFEDFLKRDGARVLRKITGRDGIVISNGRGVSSNA